MEETKRIKQNKQKFKLSEISKNQELLDILESTSKVIGRIYFVRHGESELEANKDSNINYVPQGPGVELSREGNNQIETTSTKLKSIGLSKNNSKIIYSEDTYRIIESVRIMSKIIFGENYCSDENFEENILLSTTNKEKKGDYYIDKKNENRTIETAQLFIDTTNFMKKIRKRVLDGKEKFRNLILIGHRSNKAGVTESVFNKDREVIIDFEIKSGEILEFDITTEGYYLNREKEKDILFINIYNYELILKELENELGLTEIIQQFQSQELQIWELQNYVNAYFRSKAKLFEKYILSKNLKLKLFSLINLIKLGKKDIILSNIKNLSGNSEIKESLSQLIHTEQDENIKNLAKEILYEINIYEFLEQHYQKNINPIIQEVRSRSLDVRIRNGEDIHPTFRFENKKYNDDIINIVSGNQGIKVIQANAGSGKSFFMSYLNQLLYKKIHQYDKKLYPIYINLSGKNLFQIKEKIIELQKDKLNGLSEIYLLDSLDEALLSEVDKDKFFQYLTKIGSPFIITSRPGHIPKDYQEKVETIILKEFRKKDIDNFVLSYFGEDKDKLQNFQKFTQNNWVEDICNNPLMLSMICEIINGRDYDFVRNIEDIKNISDLYDAIITLRLYIWNKEIKDREIMGYKSNLEIDTKRKKKNIERRKKLLAKLAYDSYLMDKAIDENYILDLEEAENIYDIESLNLIYRKGDNGRFAFVHESFREYFVSSYFFDKINISQNKEELILDLVKLFDIGIIGHNDVKLQLAKDIISFFEKPPQKNSPRLPLATFCFDGPSGVGKSTFIKIINKIFFLFRYYSGIENLNILELSNLNLNIDSFSVFEGEEYFEYYSMRRYFDNYNNGRRTFIDKNEDLSSTIVVIESRDCFVYNGNDIVCESKESQLGFKKLMGEDYIGKIDYLYKLGNLSRKLGKEILTREILKYNRQIMEFMAINKQVALSVVVLDDVLDYVIEQGFDEDYGARSLLGTFDKLIIDKIELSMENGELYSKIKKGYKYRLYVYIKNEKIKLSLMEIGKIKIPKKSKEEQTPDSFLSSRTNLHSLELYGSQYTEVPILESAQDGMKNTDFSWIHQKPSIGNRKILEDFEKKLAEKQKDSLFTRFMEGKGGNNIIDITSLFDGKILSFPENIDSLHSIIIEVQKLEIEYVKTYCISYEEGIDYSDRLNEIISRLVSLGITEKDLKDLMKSAMIASIDYLGFIDSYRNIILTIDERENTNLFSPIHNNSIKKMVNHFIFEAMDMGLKAEDAEMKEIISAIVYRVENLVNKSLNAKQLKALRELIAKAFTEYKK